MKDFFWDKDVSVSLTRRAARLGLVCFSWVVVCGVVASVVLPLAHPSLRKVTTGGPTVLAAVNHKLPAAKIATGVELIKDVKTTPDDPNVVWMTVTAYCPCPICCGRGANGITASGKKVTASGGHFVAAPAGFAFGNRLVVPGYDHGRPVPVLDRGGAIKGDRLDVFFPDHEAARQWGRQRLPVTVLPQPIVRDLVAAVGR